MCGSKGHLSSQLKLTIVAFDDSVFKSCQPEVRECRGSKPGKVRPVTWNACCSGYCAGHGLFVCLFVGCLASQQQASVSQGRICSDNFTCCHTEIKVADQTFYLTQSQYTDTGPTSPSADPITPGAWQGSRWSANV